MEKDLSVSEKKKKKIKKKERAGRAGEAEWGQGRQCGPLRRGCARRGFAWGLSAFPAGKIKDPHALTPVCEGYRERCALSIAFN